MALRILARRLSYSPVFFPAIKTVKVDVLGGCRIMRAEVAVRRFLNRIFDLTKAVNIYNADDDAKRLPD